MRLRRTSRESADHISAVGGPINRGRKTPWPIGDLYHARLAVIYALSPRHADVRQQVLRAVQRHYPAYDWAGFWEKHRKDQPSWQTIVGARHNRTIPQTVAPMTREEIQALKKEVAQAAVRESWQKRAKRNGAKFPNHGHIEGQIWDRGWRLGGETARYYDQRGGVVRYVVYDLHTERKTQIDFWIDRSDRIGMKIVGNDPPPPLARRNPRGRDLSLSETLAWEQEAERRNVSAVARGEARSADGGFLAAYRKAKTLSKLPDYWKRKRDGFIARHMAQLEKNREPLFESNGKPTRRHLGLIMWAFSPADSLPRRNPRPQPPRPHIHPAIIDQKRREEEEREWERRRPQPELPVPHWEPPHPAPNRRHSAFDIDFDLAQPNPVTTRAEVKALVKAARRAIEKGRYPGENLLVYFGDSGGSPAHKGNPHVHSVESEDMAFRTLDGTHPSEFLRTATRWGEPLRSWRTPNENIQVYLTEGTSWRHRDTKAYPCLFVRRVRLSPLEELLHSWEELNLPL